jgi:hypothetical protein
MVNDTLTFLVSLFAVHHHAFVFLFLKVHHFFLLLIYRRLSVYE